MLFSLWLFAACAPLPALPTAPASPTQPQVDSTTIPAATTHARAQLGTTPSFTLTLQDTSANPSAYPTDLSNPDPCPNPRYQLSVELDYARHELFVEEHIAYTNPGDEPLGDLALMIEPLLYAGAFRWNRFSWGDGTPILVYGLYPGRLTIPLDDPLGPGESLSLWIEYALHLPRLRPEAAFRQLGPLGYTDLQANLTDWYPFIPPYLPGAGWLAHDPASYGEHLVYALADFEVSIRPVGTMNQLVIAASAPVHIEDGVYHYQFPNARNFTWSVSPYYRTKTETVDDIMVHSYYFSEHWAGGQRALATTVEALRLYSRLFAPYPHTSMSAVEADFVDGMEYDGLYFLGGDFYALHNHRTADFLVALAAHETAHQWWYGLVGNDQALEPWLDEALSTYCEYLFYEQLYPDDLEWWWTYRLMYYQPQGPIDISIYDVQGTNRYRDYRDPVYLNGALFLDDLRKTIGDEAFFRFLQDYLDAHQYGLVSQAHFFSTLLKHTDKDISALLQTYFSEIPSLGDS